MIDALGLAAWLLLPLIGLITWRAPFVREMRLGARIAIATAAGALIVALLMGVYSVAGISWGRTTLLPPLVVLAAVGVVIAARTQRAWGADVASARTPTSDDARDERTTEGRDRRRVISRVALAGTIVIWGLTMYGTITARESCGDYQFTWGPKAIRFYRAGGIDASVLHTYPQLTVDYPPLHTLLLAFTNVLSQRFSWWASILVFPLFFLALIALVRDWTRDELSTLLLTAALAWTFTMACLAGCAEPELLLYEAIVIGALTFLEPAGIAQPALVTLGLAGAVWTKLEGSTFAVAAFLAILIVQRNARRALAVVAIPAILIGSWMAFVFKHDLLYMYGGARLPMYPSVIPVVLKTLLKVAAFDVWWLPWIVPIVLIAIGDVRRAAMPIAFAVLTLCATVYFYIHYYDPVWWIESSSNRVLLTPLLALLLGAAAAHRRPAAS